MTRHSVVSICLSTILIVIATTCATVSQPGGGPKDMDPPVLIESVPKSGQLNFTQKNIYLEFDELIQLNDPKNQIIVTPRLREEYEIEYKQNKVYMEIQEELLENTTYTISFRNSIQDVTERNPATDLAISFSTGNYIDSAYIEGYVFDVLTESPLEKMLVGLYFAEDTASIIDLPPDYLTLSDEEGKFRINNLAKGRYRIYALGDKNQNSIIDFKNELHGFHPDTLQLDTSLLEIEIPMVMNNLIPMELKSARASGKYFEVKFNKTLFDYEIISERDLYYKLTEDKDGIKFYNTIGYEDSTQVIINTIDSTGYNYSDTIMLKIPESPRGKDSYTLSVQTEPILRGIDKLAGELLFSKPSFALDNDSMRVWIDSLNELIIDTTSFKWFEKRTKATFEIDLNEYLTDSTEISKSYIEFGKNAFISIEEDSSFSSTKRISSITSDKFGSIEVSPITEQEDYIIQLLDPKLNVIDESTDKTQKIVFNYLLPGNYFLRVIIDDNKNGRWDAGDVTKRIEPEKVKFFTYESGEYQIVLRANFIIGPLEFEF